MRLVLLALLLAACGPILKGGLNRHTTNILPKPVPPQGLPVAVGPLPVAAASDGVVVVSATNVPVRISAILEQERGGWYGYGYERPGLGVLGSQKLETRLVCVQTPCAFTLPAGAHSLLVEAADSTGWGATTEIHDIHVTPTPQLLTYTASRRRVERHGNEDRSVVGIVLESFGWSALVCSPVPFLVAEDSTAGVITVAIGAMLVGMGYALYEPTGTEVTYVPASATVSAFAPE